MKTNIDIIKTSLENIANSALEIDSKGEVEDKLYNDRDILNALITFSHVFGNASAHHFISQGKNEEGLKVVSEEMLKLKECIFKMTGIDTYKLAEDVLGK